MVMNRAWPLLLLALACAKNGGGGTGIAQLEPGNHEFALSHDDRTRRYIVHVPPGASGSLPVVLAYHGGGGDPAGYQAYAGLDAIADQEGFLVVYPYGTGVLPRRLLTWNGGGCCGYSVDNDIDDVGFTAALLDDLEDRTRIDRTRVYATGHSNGAIMAYRVAAERADLVAAVVPVAGAMSLPSFAPSRPVAVLHIHSVDDPRALYDGGLGPPFPGTNNREFHQPVMDGVEAWATRNGCAKSPSVVSTRSGEAGSINAGQTATLLSWAECDSGYDVAHWRLTGAGHGWPGREDVNSLVGPPTTLVDAADEAWSFMQRFRR